MSLVTPLLTFVLPRLICLLLRNKICRCFRKETRNCHCCCHRIHLKISLLLIIGIYVTYFVFDGFDDIYVKAALLDNFDKKNTIGG
jgi:hypothetical protein